MRRQRNLKIVATLGPASNDYETIRALYDAGVDMFRLNMSHGTHDDILRRHAIVRQVEADVGRPVAILADLQGPKLRVGDFAQRSADLEEGAKFRFDLDATPGDGTRVQLPHPEIFEALTPGATLPVNDGKMRFRVDACGRDFANCTVMTGGTISNHKGVNVPDVVLPLAALSEKDRRDLEFACELGVDWLALSFVQRGADVDEARELTRGRAALMSKIEKPAAVKAYAEILAASDGIMVARGDLGVELPVQSVPPIQKRLVRGARAAAKPVIVATQMLESMIESPMPTRAEVSDVAAAIYEGADAVMLSAESAAGRHPVEAVRMMDAGTAHRGRRHRGRRARDRRDDRHPRDLLLQPDRDHGVPGRAGAPAGADPGDDAAGGHGAAAVPELGSDLSCGHRTGDPLQGGGDTGGAGGDEAGLRDAGQPDPGDGGRSVQRAGHDQHPARGTLRRTVDHEGRERITFPLGESTGR